MEVIELQCAKLCCVINYSINVGVRPSFHIQQQFSGFTCGFYANANRIYFKWQHQSKQNVTCQIAHKQRDASTMKHAIYKTKLIIDYLLDVRSLDKFACVALPMLAVSYFKTEE
jgi:hypothetical protein